MTRIDFYLDLDNLLHDTCRLLRKIAQTTHQVIVSCPDENLQNKLDLALWQFSPLDFIAHVKDNHPHAARTPIVLVQQDQFDWTTPWPHDVLLNLSQSIVPSFSRFERLLELVSTDESNKAKARERYKFYRDRGYQLALHQRNSQETTR